ncbi:MAG TPA: PTS sugar transporter subunit IIB [Gemmatimonadaceae bacterium]|nr:PTS sugar transporter subunit IIB [Gemmatimonadaceae bacterium]
MTLVLNRIDDRLIHGQVVVGWGQPLDIGFIVLVDDEVACSEWEQELYRMGTPPEMQVHFYSVDAVTGALPTFTKDERPGILLTGNVDAMLALVTRAGVREVNIGGIHHRADRKQRLRYVFLSPKEEQVLRRMGELGATVTAQDVPSSRPIELSELLESEASVQ